MMNTKRKFLLISIIGLGAVVTALSAVPRRFIKSLLLGFERFTTTQKPAPQTPAEVFLAKNGTPQENVVKAIEMMGGIDHLIGINDIVLLKPNAQWWNQGRTNLAAIKGFIDLVLGIPGFKGEIIIGENQHFMDDFLPEAEKDNVRGWSHFGEINGDINGVNNSLNSLVEHYHDKGDRNVTKSHWRDGGAKEDVWGNGQNGGIVKSPAEGNGYVWSDIDFVYQGLWGLRTWKVKMTYPIFTSTYSSITVDFKNGAYQRDGDGTGHYINDKPVKLINFSVLNDHGSDTGITGAIKNYMGITDLSCGWWGLQPKGYVNVHACGADYYPHAKAGPLAYFIKTIRKADLNIVTAEWVGLGSRTDVNRATRLRTILVSKDPVALDYYGAKYIMFPLSKKKEHHDPDYPNSAVGKFLNLAQNVLGEGALSDDFITLHQHDFKSRGYI